jgi:hypothetical protein
MLIREHKLVAPCTVSQYQFCAVVICSPLINLLDRIGRISSEPWHLGIGHCDVRGIRRTKDVVQEVTGV